MKKNKLKIKDFDEDFDKGEIGIDFKNGILTEGLSKVVKIPPMTIPAWVALEIEKLSKIHDNKTNILNALSQLEISNKQSCKFILISDGNYSQKAGRFWR